MTRNNEERPANTIKLVHPSDDQFIAFLRGTLEGDLREAVTEHLRVCFLCRSEMEIAQESFREESSFANQLAPNPIAIASDDTAHGHQAAVDEPGQWFRHAIDRLAELVANLSERCIEWTAPVRFAHSTAALANLGAPEPLPRLMGADEEHRYEALFPAAVNALRLPVQFNALKLVIEDRGAALATLSVLLEPNILPEEALDHIVEVLVEVRDRANRIIAKLPLRPGIQNQSKPIAVRLGTDPGNFEGTLSVVLYEVLPEVPIDNE